jgi:Phosphoesterase family
VYVRRPGFLSRRRHIRNFDARRRGRNRTGLRKIQDYGLLVTRERRLAALHGAQSPALMFFAYSQTQGSLRGLVDENAEALVAAGDGADQRKLRTLVQRRLVVSPFAKPGYISHDYADHVSIVKFIERNWELPTITRRSRDNFPNPVAEFRSPYIPLNSPAISDLFGFFEFADRRDPAGTPSQ